MTLFKIKDRGSKIETTSKIQLPKLKFLGILSLGFWICLALWILILGFPVKAWRLTKELEQEIKAKKTAVAKNLRNPEAQFDLAITYAYTNNLLTGMDTLKKIPEINPNFKSEALQYYVTQVNLSPNDWRLRFRLAFAYYFNDRKLDAVREFKNVLILDPGNVWAYGYISLLYGDLGEVGEAVTWVKKGLAIDSNVAALHLLLAEGYYKQGDAWMGWRERLEALRLKALGY